MQRLFMRRSAILCALLIAGATHSGESATDMAFAQTVRPFFAQHCNGCHSPLKKKGGLDLTGLDGNVERAAETWGTILDQLTERVMPPETEKQPDAALAARVADWIQAKLPKRDDSARRMLPRSGNLVPHDKLFAKGAAPTQGAPARIWRLRPEAYLGMVNDVKVKLDRPVQPFSVVAESGFKDYAALYSVDEAGTEILLDNAEQIVTEQSGYSFKTGKPTGRKAFVPEFKLLFDPAKPPASKQIQDALRMQFRLAVARDPSAEELARLMKLYESNLKVADQSGAIFATLTAILLRADAVYRIELGAAAGGRRMLTAREIARAVSLALSNRREPGLFAAADKGELKTREEVAAHVRRILDDPKIEKPRIMDFFHEYFGYDAATEVFKASPKDVVHKPNVLVQDTDRLVRHILASDKNVLRELLSTDLSFVNYGLIRDSKTKLTTPGRAAEAHPINNRGCKHPEAVYGFDVWPDKQPVQLPQEQRAGILTQPSWLAAYSTNFDNDPVRRGRWVRERLLGGVVPELPIGVEAKVPDGAHRTLRDRMVITRADQCWKCHRRMDDLGYPFEQFDQYGKFRTAEKIHDLDAMAKNVDKKGKPLNTVILHDATLDSSGRIADSGDPALDGPVKNAVEMIHKLANSERVRQVFIRHVFRFMLGRNEQLDDSQTLQMADRAYVESGGSFKALLVSLLSSDSFLFRVDAPELKP